MHESRPLRVFVADEAPESLDELAALVRRLGHEVAGVAGGVDEVADIGESGDPDAALVGFGPSRRGALRLVSAAVRQDVCPVIAVLDEASDDLVREAARRGAFSYVLRHDADMLRSVIDIVVRRYSEFRSLEGAFGRRALIERAKGILMERHQISAGEAFLLLRRRSQETGRKVTEIARAVEESHPLLPPEAPPAQDV